jgi:hypothetical protein
VQFSTLAPQMKVAASTQFIIFFIIVFIVQLLLHTFFACKDTYFSTNHQGQIQKSFASHHHTGSPFI